MSRTTKTGMKTWRREARMRRTRRRRREARRREARSHQKKVQFEEEGETKKRSRDERDAPETRALE